MSSETKSIMKQHESCCQFSWQKSLGFCSWKNKRFCFEFATLHDCDNHLVYMSSKDNLEKWHSWKCFQQHAMPAAIWLKWSHTTNHTRWLLQGGLSPVVLTCIQVWLLYSHQPKQTLETKPYRWGNHTRVCFNRTQQLWWENAFIFNCVSSFFFCCRLKDLLLPSICMHLLNAWNL